jgi:phosphate transport system substrate-binding protein
MLPFGAIAQGKTFDIEGFGDHSLWVLVNDVRRDFEKDTGASLRLVEEFAIAGKGCAKGIVHAFKGKPDRHFGLVCCDLNPDQVRKAGLKVYPVALEPLAVVVNKKNPVKGLTVKQVREIFSGRITRWEKAGGPRGKIVVITRLHCKEHTANWTSILRVDEFAAKRMDVASEPDMARTVADFDMAIGHLEMTSVADSGQKLKVLPIDGHMPSSEDMRKGLYPFSTTLSVVTKGDAGGKVLRLIEYLRKSPKAAEIMRKYGMTQITQ